MKDLRGNTVSGADTAALSIFEQAQAELQCYVGDPVATIDRAIAAAPRFAMAHLFKAYVFLAGTEVAGLPVARECREAAAASPTNARERQHLAAVDALIAGEYDQASERLEDILLDHPCDALALQIGHVFDYFRGDARTLRDRVARVLPEWSAGVPGYHAVLGMHAFGLEECGEYGRAEEAGRKAVELHPTDAWAHHAVAHVLEMQGRVGEGLAWMGSRQEHWAPRNFFAVHNWWHWALFHLDRDEHDRVLALYDGPIRETKSKVVLDMIDASAMLWRLHLRGLDLGPRWGEIAEAWQPLAEDGFYAFNDCHAMMAFVGAERWDLADATLVAMAKRLEQPGSNAMMTETVGLPVARALHAFGRGKYAAVVELLRPVRAIAHRFGGSNAQRDLLDLTLIEAARRDNQVSLLRALARERLSAKPASPLNQRYLKAAQPSRAAA